MIRRACLFLAVLIAALSSATSMSFLTGLTGESVRAQAPDTGTPAQRESGKNLYNKYCVQCHGDKGDGEGYAAPHLRPRPRNFTTGKFKIRTTVNGALPTHQDLVNIIRHGMPYTSMPAWPTLTDQELSDLAYFVTTFSPNSRTRQMRPRPCRFRARRARRRSPSSWGRRSTRRPAASSATARSVERTDRRRQP
jgi:cytochrome c